MSYAYHRIARLGEQLEKNKIDPSIIDEVMEGGESILASTKPEKKADWLREAELDDGEACQLRRTLRADGGSRAWINGRPVPVSQLAELAALLVEIHGQHEQQALLVRARQLQLLDAYARHPALLAATREAAAQWKTLQAERDALLARGDVAERQAWVRHLLEERSVPRSRKGFSGGWLAGE